MTDRDLLAVYADLMSYLEGRAKSRVAVCPARAGHVRELRANDRVYLTGDEPGPS